MMMFQYNNIDDLSVVFGLSIPQLKSWARKNETVAMCFDLAHKECKISPNLKDTVRFLSTKTIAEINNFFGFDPSINKLAWTQVPIITLRSWHKESPVTYVAFLLGQQKVIVNRLISVAGEDMLQQILNELDVSEIIKMYCVSPSAYEKLLCTLKC